VCVYLQCLSAKEMCNTNFQHSIGIDYREILAWE
jgi:hypothetical protein